MFKQAQVKLTIVYSLLFLSLFWIFSFGLYFWMNKSFEEGYISQVKKVQQQQTGQHEGTFEDTKTAIVILTADVALDQLRNILIGLNGVFFVIIPVVSWFLAKRALKPIEIIHEQQKQFVSDASHELKTPLSIMSGEMEVVLKKKRTAQDYRQIIISNKEEVGRLTNLVESLLFLARDDQKKYVFQTRTVDITDIINIVRTQLQHRIKEKKLTVRFEPASGTIVVQGHEDLLKQLFYNLLDNAIKYTPVQGKIWISLQKKKQTAVIAIRDTGIGIPQSEQERVFDRFYRIDTARSAIKGYGLGLSIVKTIIEKHKGNIKIFSAKGKGTTVIVSIP